MRRSAGFTIIELLIAAFILVIILGIITAGISSGGRVVGSVITDAVLIEDTRVAGQMIADGVSKAAYVYPPSTTLKLSNNGATSRNPATGNGTWTVGKHPIIAYLERPEDLSGTCSGGANREACATVVAYYPVRRGELAPLRGYRHLDDERNEDAWVLMEYRDRLTEDWDRILNGVSNAANNVETELNGQAQMLADFIVPTTGFVPYGIDKDPGPEGAEGRPTCQIRASNGTDVSIDPTACRSIRAKYADRTEYNYLDTVVTGQFTLQAEFNKAVGTTSTQPATFSIRPRNLITP